MKDCNGAQISVGDYIRSTIKEEIYGKVCNITPDGRVMYLDDGGFVQTITEADVGAYMIHLTPYSSVRRRHLANALPTDFFTLSDYPKGCDLQQYDHLYYFNDQIIEAMLDASKDVDAVDLDTLSGYKEAVSTALADNADEAGFMQYMTAWFSNNA